MSLGENEKKEKKVNFRDVCRFAVHYWRPRKWMGLLSAALMMSAVITDAILPVYTGKIVDALTHHNTNDALAWKSAWTAFGGFMTMGFMYHVFRVSSAYLWNRFASIALYGIVTDGMKKVQRFSSDWHANAFAGGTVRKITRGMWSFDTFEDTLLMNLLPAITIMVGITIMLSVKLPTVGLMTAVLILIYCGVSIWTSVRILAPKFRDSADMDTKMGASLADAITGNPTVKSFGAEHREDSIFEGVASVWRKKSLHAWQVSVVMDGFRSFFRVGVNSLMVAVTIWLWHAGKASPGDIVLVITSFFIITGYLKDIGQHINHLQRSISEMDDVVSFWLREDDVRDAPDAKKLAVKPSSRKDIVAFDDVGFKYSSTGDWIYRGFSVTIAAGEKLALVGPSGSGKSTFVKLLQRLYNVNEGRILIDGQDISKVTLESLRQAISLVPQDPILFHRSLADNIAYGKPGATMDDIVDAAKKAYAHEFIKDLPRGYDTLVGERGIKLSGGERQRVAIARAILADAPILVMDEATSSLDSISEHYIQLALDALTKGRTTITIAHRLSTIQQADRILVFDHGKIVEHGTHHTLLSDPGSHYKKLYDMQVLGLIDGQKAANAA